ncbi:MAG: lipoprotein signal peptidase [Flavobacteriaceae bacterium]|jgi:signal peptidase II|nr:lipoprotein signal peptidase [Flavobacteriaceae bacterium LSUCC0859]
MFKKPILLAFVILIFDQLVKLYVKTHFVLGESIEVFSWFQILFIENEGAAWGAKLSDFLPISDSLGKLILSVFRLFAIMGIGYWFISSVKKQAPMLLQMAQALIFAGALGNIVDSVFYGVIFNESHYQVASLFAEQPYGSLLQGRVVDMLYFPLIDSHWPSWVPFFGGDTLRFFEPVFNIADTSISVGVGLLLVFNKKAFPETAA